MPGRAHRRRVSIRLLGQPSTASARFASATIRKATSAPGAFYEYPGDPRKIGTGIGVLSSKPS